MLYLPPDWAHEGTAVGNCMTFSVGFRAPSRHELLRAFLGDCADDTPSGPDPRYADAGAAPTLHPGQIPTAMHMTLSRWLTGWRPTKAQVDDFVGRYVTEPKASVWFEAPQRPLSPGAFAARLGDHSVTADRRTRFSYRAGRFFVNGESLSFEPGMRAALIRLADERRLPPGALAATPVDSPLVATLHAWWDSGWIHLERSTAAARRRPRRSQP